MSPKRDGLFVAIVQGTHEGGHGPYATATIEKGPIANVTFSLKPPVWEEGDSPEAGVYVIVSNLKKKRAGWRAESARYMRPSDEQ